MIKNIKVIVLMSLMSAPICLYSYAQESSHIKTKSNVYVLANGQKLITEGKYQQAIQLLNTIIKQNPQNAEAYYLRGISYYLMADEWHTLERFHAAIPFTSKELAAICYAIDTHYPLPKRIDNDPQFQPLKKLIIAYHHFLDDTEKASSLEPNSYTKRLPQFMRGHPISLLMAKAFLGD